jgi:hypothetical protein
LGKLIRNGDWQKEENTENTRVHVPKT